jgi:hypothetical protein
LSTPDDALVDVDLEHAESLLVAVDRQLQRVQHSLGRVVIGDDPLRNDDRLSGHAHRLRIEGEIDDQLLGSARHATKIRIR